MEVTPDAQLVISSDLSNRHPLVVRAHSRELAVGKAGAGGGEGAADVGVVRIRGASLPRLVSDFMVVLYRLQSVGILVIL